MDSKNETDTNSSSPVSSPQSVEELTRRNVETVRKLEEAAQEQRTSTDRVADAIAGFCGSMTFVWVHVAWFGGWIALNLLPGLRHIDPFPFTFLTLVVSLEAIFLSTFILISQNHDSRVSEKRNHLDLQINLLSEQENTKMLTILHQIADKVGVEFADDSHARVLQEETRPEKLAEQIEQLGDGKHESAPRS
ncbi:MAG: hypothetical protein JWM21_2089 [Acidobacteria bacterium]|nr:hypothetical protein [Acidobacteriota bacterium]